MGWLRRVLVVGAVVLAGSAWSDVSADLARLDDLISAGRPLEAITLARSLLADPEYEPRSVWRVRQRLGVALMAAGRPEEAVADFEAALLIEPAEPALHLNLGRALRRTGQGGRAVAEFGVAIDLAPDAWSWRLEYAEALSALGIQRDALAQIRLARAACNDCPEALRGEANHFLARGDAAGSIEPLRALLAVQADPAVRRLLAGNLSALGDAAGVVALLDTVPEETLAGQEVMDLLQADRALGHCARALAWIRGEARPGAGDWQPGSDFWAIAAEICLAAGHAADALTAIDRALAISAGSAVYHHNRAAILLELGREDEARRALREARRLDPRLGKAGSAN